MTWWINNVKSLEIKLKNDATWQTHHAEGPCITQCGGVRTRVKVCPGGACGSCTVTLVARQPTHALHHVTWNSQYKAGYYPCHRFRSSHIWLNYIGSYRVGTWFKMAVKMVQVVTMYRGWAVTLLQNIINTTGVVNMHYIGWASDLTWLPKWFKS